MNCCVINRRMASDQQIERYEGDTWKKASHPGWRRVPAPRSARLSRFGISIERNSTRPSAADGGGLSLGCGTIAFQMPIDEVARFHGLMHLIEASSTSKSTRSMRKYCSTHQQKSNRTLKSRNARIRRL